jgi:hypothetical protein
MSESDQYRALRHALERSGSAQEPAEVHGTLCGMLCMHENADPAAAVEGEREAGLSEPLAALRELTLERLFDSDAGFMPILPDDEDASLTERVRALARWCAGFVYGLASGGGLDLSQLSDEVSEVVEDLTELSKAVLMPDEAETEAAERDYAELVEYVRVGAQLVFLELRPARGSGESERLH